MVNQSYKRLIVFLNVLIARENMALGSLRDLMSQIKFHETNHKTKINFICLVINYLSSRFSLMPSYEKKSKKYSSPPCTSIRM